MTKCANCGTQHDGSAKFCKSCGKSLAQAVPAHEQLVASSNCPACASAVAPHVRFCKTCGTGLTDRVAAAVEPAVSVADFSGMLAGRPAHDSVSAGRVVPDGPTTAASLSAGPGVDAVTQARARATPAACTAPASTPPVDVAPVVTPSVDAAPISTPPTSVSAHNARTRGSPSLIAGTTAIVLASLVGAGTYWWSGSHKSTDTAPQADAAVLQTPAPVPAPRAAPAEPVSPPAPERSTFSGADAPAPPQAPAATSPQSDRPVATPAEEAFDVPRTGKPAQPKWAAPAPRPQTRPALQSARSNSLHDKVATMLSKGDGYIANQQYDKAVATGESVLVLDPDNAAAKALIRQAKARQLDALKSGTSLD